MCLRDAEKPKKTSDLDARLRNLITYQTYTIFQNICRGLFENHRLTFALIICKGIMVAEGKMLEKEWMLFMKGAGIVDRKKQLEDGMVNPFPKHNCHSVGPLQWDVLCAMNNELGK